MTEAHRPLPFAGLNASPRGYSYSARLEVPDASVALELASVAGHIKDIQCVKLYSVTTESERTEYEIPWS